MKVLVCHEIMIQSPRNLNAKVVWEGFAEKATVKLSPVTIMNWLSKWKERDYGE